MFPNTVSAKTQQFSGTCFQPVLSVLWWNNSNLPDILLRKVHLDPAFLPCLILTAQTERFQRMSLSRGQELERKSEKAVSIKALTSGRDGILQCVSTGIVVREPEVKSQLCQESNTPFKAALLLGTFMFLHLFFLLPQLLQNPLLLTWWKTKWVKCMWEHFASYTETEVIITFPRMQSPRPANHLIRMSGQKANRDHFLSIMSNQRSRLLHEVGKDALKWLFKPESVDRAGTLRKNDIIPFNGKYRVSSWRLPSNSSRTPPPQRARVHESIQWTPSLRTYQEPIQIQGVILSLWVIPHSPNFWESGTEFGSMISVTRPLKHHLAIPEMSLRKKQQKGTINRKTEQTLNIA